MQTKGARVPSRPYPFVDWMKALGMGVIVYGHVAHATTVPLTPPIYLKQFGVAFFLFASGFTLARERRSAGETVFNRLFQVYLFGLSLAMLLTIVNVLSGGHGAPSNYLPFAAGLNVIVDNFPANPTTQCVDFGFFERIVSIARQHDVLVAHDLAYADIVFDGYQSPSILQVPGAADPRSLSPGAPLAFYGGVRVKLN